MLFQIIRGKDALFEGNNLCFTLARPLPIEMKSRSLLIPLDANEVRPKTIYENRKNPWTAELRYT
jgi:hypothetical protein